MLYYSIMVIVCSISCNYLMIGLRRVDKSLAGRVTETDQAWEARPGNTTDMTTTIANEAFAYTQDTESSPWEVEMSPRLGRRSTIDEG
jgi:hypothetical protein